MREKTLLGGEPLRGRRHGEWLEGATARNMKYDIQGTCIETKTTFTGFENYCFDNPARTFNSEESKLITGTTNAEGNAQIDAKLEVGAAASGMLMANLVTRVFEESGAFSIDAVRRLYSPFVRYAGIRSPQKGDNPLNTGSNYQYEVASVNYLGQPQANQTLDVNVYKVTWYWWWSSDPSQLSSFMSDSYNKPVKQLQLKTDADGKSSFMLNFPNDEWGTYYITVTDRESKHSSGILSYYDWPDNAVRRNPDGSSSARQLTFTLDKDSYLPGENLAVTFLAIEGSRAVVCI